MACFSAARLDAHGQGGEFGKRLEGEEGFLRRTVQCEESEIEIVRRILKESIEMPKILPDGSEYPIRFSSEQKGPSERYSFS